MKNKSHHQFEYFILNKKLTIFPDPFECVLKDNNRTIWHLKSIGYRLASGGWQSIHNGLLQKSTSDTLELVLFESQQQVLNFIITIHASSFDIQLQSMRQDIEWISIKLAADQDEHFVGFGERFDSIDQRGKQVTLWVEDGACMDLSYIPVPFYMSNRGYGLLLDTTVKSIARMAMDDDPHHAILRIASPEVSMKIILGESLKQILSDYTQCAGRPDVPPDWVFGPWKSRDWQTANQQGILEDIEQQIELGLPATVKLIDARWEVAYHSFQFDPKKFPDPKGMIDEIHAKGNRLLVWITPWMAVNNYTDPNDYYEVCAEKGYFLKRPDGEIHVSQMGMNPMLVGSCIDFTNPEAIAWFQDQLRYLLELGVDGFQTDFGEQVPEDAVFFDGRTGKGMHNLYPWLYNEITYQTVQAVKPSVLLTRSGWHGSQKHSVIWAGDQSSDFSLNSGMHTALIAGQTSGLSGFPYWSSDIGGYFGDPTDEVYMRWTQFSAFSPIMMIHGAGKREPWYFSDQTLQNYRKFSRFHTDLFPYIYTFAHIASITGLPIMRAMILEFEQDPGIWGKICEDQYCFGSDLLVAPIHYGFSRERPVYLPAGFWRDFWTGELYEGGREIMCNAELDQIPVFAKVGAIIPRLDPTPQTLVKTSQNENSNVGQDLRVDIYPGIDGQFELYDGTIFQWNETKQQLTISQSPMERLVSVRLVNGKSRQYFKVTNPQKEISVSHHSLSAEKEYSRAKVDHETVIFQLDKFH